MVLLLGPIRRDSLEALPPAKEPSRDGSEGYLPRQNPRNYPPDEVERRGPEILGAGARV